MPARIASFDLFERKLGRALEGAVALAKAHPGDADLRSISRQLEALRAWTKGRQTPTPEQRDKLSFGRLASRTVHPIDPRLAADLYEIASSVTYW